MSASFKRLLFLCGVILAGGAFVAAGADLAAGVINRDLSLLPGAGEVWRTLAPESFEAALALLGAGPLGEFLVSKVLALPGWLLLGAPGLALIITCRVHDDDPIDAEHLRSHEQSLFLFDELAKRAHEDGFSETPDEVEAHNHPDFTPADPRYARDDVVDDLADERVGPDEPDEGEPGADEHGAAEHGAAEPGAKKPEPGAP